MLADVESRLLEWSRWVRSYGRRRRCTGSIEGRYRSPQHWEPITIAPDAPPIAWRAYEVELVVVALVDPFRSIIVAVYIRHTPEPILRRIARRQFRVGDVAAVLAEARRRVGVALDSSARPRSPVPGYPRLSAVGIIAPASI